MKRKLILPVLFLFALAAAGVYYRIYARPQPMRLTGIVTTHNVLVSSQVEGQLQKLLVKEGDTVKAGQVLASIHPAELQADRSYYAHSEQSTGAQVAQAEAALRFQEAQTRDQISQAEASLSAAQAPAIIMWSTSTEPVRVLPRMSTSLPTATMPMNISFRLPATVISSTGY